MNCSLHGLRAFALRALLLIAPTILLGCTQDRIVLLPSPDGHASKLQVKHGATATELTKPYEQVAVGNGGSPRTSVLTPVQVQKRYGATLNGMAKTPVTYALYFLGDSDELTDESKMVATQVLAEIGKTPLAEVVIIGHTDTTGTQDYNDELSLSRANVVRDKLIKQGVEPNRIETAGRGERELMIKTPDETTEPRNRRVEIDVR